MLNQISVRHFRTYFCFIQNYSNKYTTLGTELPQLPLRAYSIYSNGIIAPAFQIIFHLFKKYIPYQEPIMNQITYGISEHIQLYPKSFNKHTTSGTESP